MTELRQEPQVAAPALPRGTWEIDTLWSNIGYEVRHMGVVASRGWFRSFRGEIVVDDDGPSARGTVDLGSLDSGDWARDEHVKGRLFLAYEDFPELMFETTRFDVADNGSVEVEGPLTLHGVTRDVVLRGVVTGVHEARIGLALEGEISRKAFNLRFARKLPNGVPVVADRVKLVLDLTAVPQPAATRADDARTDGDLLVRRVSNPVFGSANTYLVADLESRTAILVDAGGPVAPLLETAAGHGLELTHVLLTHHHVDHVADLDSVLAAHPAAQVLIHPDERTLVGAATGTVSPGDTVVSGGLRAEAILTAGHTRGGLSFLVAGRLLFSGDTLYRDTISTVEMSGHSDFADLRRGIERLLALPPEVEVLSGHGDPTTLARELDENPFVRVLVGKDPEGTEVCEALGRRARIIVDGSDGHGGERVWIRWEDGTDDVVPGLILERG